MDLSSPITSLIPSLDAATLEVLARTESGLGTSRIASLAGRGSRRGHQNVLDRLVAHGLVLSDPTNKGHTYRLNREHLLVPALMAALDARSQLVARLAGEVAALRPRPSHASVFGSVARGAGTAVSDIDLFLVMPDGYDESSSEWESQLQSLEDTVLAWTGNRLEVLVLDETQLDRALAAGEQTIDAVRSEGLLLVGWPVDAVAPGREVTPGRVTTRPADRGWARARLRVAEKYLEVATVVDGEDGEAVNVCVGLSVLAGIAAGDAICAAALGERCSGSDHAAAATLLGRVDGRLGSRLRSLTDLKPGAHYGTTLLSDGQRKTALRAAAALVDAARERTV